MNRISFLPVFLFFFTLANSQEKEIKYIKKGDFPDGIYMTLEDVLNKKPSSTEELTYKLADKNNSTESPEKVFFYFKEKNKKVKFPLGVSYRGDMYFQTYRKYTNKKDTGYDPDAYSRFCKVINYGRFIYFEEDMRGKFSKTLLGTLSPITYAINGKTKGIVLDLEKNEFNILRNCVDLNEFLKLKGIPEVQCDSDIFTIGDLRITIEKINKPYR